MTRLDTFTFRVDDEETKMIAKLASRLQRTRSDAVRLLIREAFLQLDSALSERQFEGSDNANANNPPQ